MNARKQRQTCANNTLNRRACSPSRTRRAEQGRVPRSRASESGLDVETTVPCVCRDAAVRRTWSTRRVVGECAQLVLVFQPLQLGLLALRLLLHAVATAATRRSTRVEATYNTVRVATRADVDADGATDTDERADGDEDEGGGRRGGAREHARRVGVHAPHFSIGAASPLLEGF